MVPYQVAKLAVTSTGEILAQLLVSNTCLIGHLERKVYRTVWLDYRRNSGTLWNTSRDYLFGNRFSGKAEVKPVIWKRGEPGESCLNMLHVHLPYS